MLRRVLVILASVLLAGGMAAGGSLEEILDKTYDARGGLEKLKAVKSARISGTYEIPGMMQAPISMEWKRPNKLRIEFSTPQGDGVQAFDGETAWALMPGSDAAQALPDDQADGIRRQADLIDGPLVDWKTKGNSVEYLGETEFEGSAVHKIKLGLPDGTEQTIFLDASNFLPIRQSGSTTMQGMETDVETYLGEYKKVGDLMLAHNIKNELIDVGMTQTLTMESVEFNIDLADERFAMPAVEKTESEKPSEE